MLRVHRYYVVTFGKVHYPRAAGDERLFIGESEAVPGFEGGYGGGQAGEADDPVEDDVDRRCGQTRGRARTGEDRTAEAVGGGEVGSLQGHELGLELGGLVPDQLDVSIGGEANELEALRVGAHDIEGLAAHAAGRAQDGDTSSHDGADVSGDLIQARRCSIPRGR
jgi:hypothetical protein